MYVYKLCVIQQLDRFISSKATVEHLIWQLLNFGDIGSQGKEHKNISAPILYAELY